MLYTIVMAKRATGVGKMKKSHSYKTKKRLEAKRLMLLAKGSKGRRSPLYNGPKKSKKR